MARLTKKEIEQKLQNNNQLAAKWLENLLEDIKTKYKNKEKLVKYLESNKKSLEVDEDWWKEFIKKIKKEKLAENNLKFIYDLYLSGQGLGIDYPEGETYETNWKKRYKNKTKAGEFKN